MSLFALLMALSTFGFSYMSYQQTASAQPQMAGMKFMMVYMMPIFMLCWFNDYSSGLCYYYLLFNLLTIAQTFLIRRMVDDGKIHAVMEANANKAKNKKKSKFQLRYEELMRQQEAQSRSGKKAHEAQVGGTLPVRETKKDTTYVVSFFVCRKLRSIFSGRFVSDFRVRS